MEIRELLRRVDPTPTIVVDHSLGNGLSRGEIETALQDAGYDLPQNDVTFYIVDTAKAWLIHYFPSLDKYAIEKLSMK
jgi:hypothetical protein